MKNALILNFTGNSYHYGCYGTAYEIYHRLLEYGYCPNYLSVKVTHRLNGYPQNGEEFIDPKFVSHFIERNPATFASLQEADIVVVNGEGTLHHLSQGSISLLYMIFLASRILNKPTYLVNHSCFPGGDMQHSDIDLLYQTALSGLIDTVIREPLSASFYERAQLTFRQGFDSLPLFIGRMGLLDLRNQGIEKNRIVLSGGISFQARQIPVICEVLQTYQKKFSFTFLTGAKADPAPEDQVILDEMQRNGMKLEIIQAQDFENWCQIIASARALISGRFHYSIAALSLAVPCISFPSNTPKTQGVYQMFDLPGYLAWEDNDFATSLTALIERACDNDLTLNPGQRLQIIDFGEKNYQQLV